MAQEKTAPTAPTIEEPADKKLVDEAIAGMEKLYETLTGSPLGAGDPATTYAPIPVERDPGEFVAERLERLVHALGQPLAATGREWAPPLVVWESPLDVVVCLDLPGVKRTDVEVIEEGGVVTVSGERPATLDGHGLQRAELPLGRFRRQILLPRTWRGSAVKAKLQDGVLEIRIGREGATTAAARKIELT
ncbi:MAG TPA: Hsp20/alpha crystallin family protein [Thermoanaerobaculia bacterium]|nr:Hsp20/alpha crystallin family protein [Thermoanaerobaculia bacterium]